MNVNMKPEIRIYFDDNSADTAEYAGYGIEEEGIPYVLLWDDNPESSALSYASSSSLGTAISLKDGRISIYTDKYMRKEAYIVLETGNCKAAEIMGHNAARLVKNIPLLPLENV